MENKEIFKTKFEYTWEEYKKTMIFMIRKAFLVSVLLIVILIILLLSLINEISVEVAFLFSFFSVVPSLIIYALLNYFIVKIKYKRMLKKNQLAKDVVTFFYEDYFIRKNNILKEKILYKEILFLPETKDNFYIIAFDAIYPINKKNLKKDEIEFIRNIKKYINMKLR